jgi:hypothetical protein
MIGLIQEFITTCWNNGQPFQAIYSIQGKAEILNPTLEGLYPVLKDVLSEIKDVFEDEYIHLGNFIFKNSNYRAGMQIIN